VVQTGLNVEEEEAEALAAALESASGSIMDVEVNNGVNIGVPEFLDFLSDARWCR
jgi:hypothetical protein